MAIKTIKYNKITWYHIDEVDEEALDFLKNNFKFHPLDIKDVAGKAEEAKIDVYGNYLFMVLDFPVLDREKGRIVPLEMDIFLGNGYLVTIQNDKFKPMRDLYFKLQNNLKYRRACFSHDSGY